MVRTRRESPGCFRSVKQGTLTWSGITAELKEGSGSIWALGKMGATADVGAGAWGFWP